MSNDSKVTSLDTTGPADVAERAAVAAPAKRIVSKSSGSDGASGKTKKINIFAGQEEGGSDAVFVSLNGNAYLIPRGQNVEVPEEIVEILNNAVTTVTAPNKTGGGITTREVPRYSFQILN